MGTFVRNHLHGTLAIDFFKVPTVRFEVLYVFVVLSLERRRILHVNVTAHPNAEWTAQQIVEAVRRDDAFTMLIRDRDGIYGAAFDRRVHNLGITQLRTTPALPGKTGTSSDSSEPSVARLSITSSCSTSFTCSDACARMRPTTTKTDLTCRSKGMRPHDAGSSLPRTEMLSRYLDSVDSAIATLGVPRECERVFHHHRIYRRLVDHALEAYLPPEGVLAISDRQKSFSLPSGMIVHLADKPILWSLASFSFEQHSLQPAVLTSREKLVTAVWPDEKIEAKAAQNRLSVALHKVKAEGFEDLLTSSSNGVALEGSIRLHRARWLFNASAGL